MDSHLASAAQRAGRTLSRQLPGISFTTHAADEWSSDDSALARCKADIEQGDIVIVTMLFLEDHFQPLLPVLKARRDQCDAMVCAMSAGEVTKLTRMGKFDMSAPASGLMALLKKLRGKANETADNKAESGAKATAGEKQMRMLRRLPKILRFIPGAAQDVRAYFLTLQYWLAGSEDNVGRMVHYLVDRYADGPRRALRGCSRRRSRWTTPSWASTTRACRSACRNARPTCRAWPPAAVVARWGAAAALVPAGRQRRPLRRRDHGAGSARPARAAGLRHRAGRPSGDREVLLRRGRPAAGRRRGVADRLLAGRGPGLQRRPGRRGDPDPAGRALRGRHAGGVPEPGPVGRLRTRPAAGRSHDDGGHPRTRRRHRLDGFRRPRQRRARGLHRLRPRLHLPGLRPTNDDVGESGHDMFSCSERADMLAARVGRLVDLGRSQRAERKVALVIFNFPPNAGAPPARRHSCRCSSRCSTPWPR
jgi:magnesium chelatase subunit H